MKNIAVFFGGESNEHDISILTGVFVLNALNKSKYNIVAVYVRTDGTFYTGDALFDIDFYKKTEFKSLKQVVLLNSSPTLYLKRGTKLKPICDIDCAINAMHGINGEDGTLFAILKANKIPTVGSDMFSSALAMDKIKTKQIIGDVLQAQYVWVNRSDFYLDMGVCMSAITHKLTFPVIVKPSHSGSSIGISKANDIRELKNALITAFDFGDKAIIEEYIQGSFDVNCAVCGFLDTVMVSEPEKPETQAELLTFEDKYMGNKVGLSREFPAKLSDLVTEKIKRTSQEIYLKYGFSGIIRIDYLVSDETVYLNEINSIPGSLAYYLFCETVADFSALLSTLIDEAIKIYNERYRNVKIFKSSVLSLDYRGVKK